MEYTGIPAQSAHALPSQPEAERSVLGAMLRSADAVMLAQESLKEDDFYDPILREIFSAMLYLSARSRPVDIVTLDEELTRRGRLEAIGGTQFLIDFDITMR